MRSLRNSHQLVLDFSPISDQTSRFYDALTEISDSVSTSTLERVEADLVARATTDPDTGRPGMSAEQAVRAAFVMQMNGYSYRKLYARIEDSILMRRFVGYQFIRVPCFKTFQNNIKAISDHTWRRINFDLVKYGLKLDLDSSDSLRIDTTAVESNIHHPTDSSLLYDAVRVLARMLKVARRLFPIGTPFHNRTRASKKLAFRILNEKEKRYHYRRLVGYTKETCGYTRKAIKALRKCSRNADQRSAAVKIAETLEEYEKLAKQVIAQTESRVFKNDQVAVADKVVSLFEPHTDVIKKGGRETVYGHKVCLAVGQRLIHDADITDGNPADSTLLIDTLKEYKKQYNTVPEKVATDAGFASGDNAKKAKALGVKELFLPKRLPKGLEEFVVSGTTAKLLGRFRAGVEGIISGAKRGARMSRAMWKGLDGFCSFVWASICAYNLRAMATALTSS